MFPQLLSVVILLVSMLASGGPATASLKLGNEELVFQKVIQEENFVVVQTPLINLGQKIIIGDDDPEFFLVNGVTFFVRWNHFGAEFFLVDFATKEVLVPSLWTAKMLPDENACFFFSSDQEVADVVCIHIKQYASVG